MRPSNFNPRLRLACAAAIATFLVSGAATAASAVLDRVRETGTMTLAYREAAAPFSFKDREGRIRGYSAELCQRVAVAVQRELGLRQLKVEWLPVDAEARIEAVASGKADAECGMTTATLTRMERVDFSLPIFVDGASVLVRGKSRLLRLADLKGRKIAVIGGTTTEQALVRALNVIEAPAVLVPVKDGAEGMAALAQGKADGFAGDRVVLAALKQQAANGKDLEFIASDFSYEPYAIVLPRNDPDFRLVVNRALAALYRSGDIDPIFQRWLGALGKPGPLLHAMFYLSTLPE
jgi:glutamate/aspartate transport system substrate-binding protein